MKEVIFILLMILFILVFYQIIASCAKVGIIETIIKVYNFNKENDK